MNNLIQTFFEWFLSATRRYHPVRPIPALVLIAMLVVAGGTRAQSDNAQVQTDRLVEVRGRFLLPDGVPASGVHVRLHGWSATGNRKIRFGLPKDWKDRETTTDQSGHFALSFPSHGAFQYSLNARLMGYAPVSWRWTAWPGNQVTNVGDIELVHGGQIVGKVVDPEGTPIPVQGQWRVSAKSNYKPAGEAGDTTLINCPTDPGTGEFSIEDVAPGPVELTVHSALTGFSKKTVKVQAGQTTQTNLVYRGPDVSRRITLVIWTKPFNTLAFFSYIDAGSVVLHGHPSGPKTFKRIPGTSQRWSVEDVPPGKYTVEIKDPKFETWSRADLSPGRSYHANLKGNAAIQLTVLDAESGAKIDDYRAKVRFGTSYHYQIRKPGTELPAKGIYDNLVPTKQVLIIEAPGYDPASVELLDLRPDETRPLSIKLSASEVRKNNQNE